MFPFFLLIFGPTIIISFVLGLKNFSARINALSLIFLTLLSIGVSAFAADSRHFWPEFFNLLLWWGGYSIGPFLFGHFLNRLIKKYKKS